jgi:hypothetical protein
MDPEGSGGLKKQETKDEEKYRRKPLSVASRGEHEIKRE